jgi:hypothetical protein
MANAVLPITQAGEWRTAVDVIAVVTGMLDPTLFGYRADPLQDMPGMTHKS